jgi:hypothetical protein
LSADHTRAAIAWPDGGPSSTGNGQIVPSDDKSTIIVFRMSDGRAVHTFELGHHGIALSDDGEILAVSVMSPEIRPTNPPADAAAVSGHSVLDGGQLWTVPGYLASLTAIPGANAVVGVFAGQGGTSSGLRVIDIATGNVRLELPLTTEVLTQVAVSSDGAVAAVAGFRLTGTPNTEPLYWIVRLADGAVLRELVGPPGRYPMDELSVSGDGQFLANVVSINTTDFIEFEGNNYAHETVVWQGDTISFRRPADFWATEGQLLAFSPDASTLLVSEMTALRQLSVPGGQVLRQQKFDSDPF